MHIKIKRLKPAYLLFYSLVSALLISCGGSGGGTAAVDTTPPTEPIGLNAVAVSSTEIDLDWTASTDDTGVTGYRIYRDGGIFATVSAVSFNNLSLNPSTYYCYNVSAIDAAGNESTQSGPACATTLAPPDTTAPTVSSTDPSSGATGVNYDATVNVVFSEDMKGSTIDASTFTLVDSNSDPVAGTVSYSSLTKTATFTPTSTFAYEETYTATVSQAVEDLAGNPMTGDVSWSFTSKIPQVSFTNAVSYPLTTSPTFIATADLNADNKMDLAVSDYDSATSTYKVSIMLGDGAGQFGAMTSFDTGPNPRAIAFGYFNADSNLDLVTANETLNVSPIPIGSVSILLGDGSGGFGAPTNFSAGKRPLGVATGYLDGDSVLDLAVANLSDNTVSILIGAGDGTFSSATDFSTGVNPNTIAIEDFNKDAKLDLAVANAVSSSVSILLGTNTGSFGTASDYSSGIAKSVAAGDLDQDGELDLLVAGGGTSVVILSGTGLGTFPTSTYVPVSQYPEKAYITELNNDGIPDLVVTTGKNGGVGNNAVYVVLGYGAGSFGPAQAVYTVSSIYISPPQVTIGDFNGDGKKDLAVANPETKRVYILLNSTV